MNLWMRLLKKRMKMNKPGTHIGIPTELSQIIDTNMFQVVFIFFVAIVILIIVNKTIDMFDAFINRKIEVEKLEEIKPVSLVKGQEAIDFIERLIKEKYNYYMYLELLPIYLDHKIPEKNKIKVIKEKIYVSVVGSLTRHVKSEILDFFTEKGIEIFIHEKIIILMNETDFRSTERFTESFREITANNVSQII